MNKTTELKINILKKSRDFSIDEVYGYLNLLDFPVVQPFESYKVFEYVSQSIKHIEDASHLEQLSQALDRAPKTLLKTWNPNCYKIFISHKTSDKLEVSELKVMLSDLGIDAFVAHEDIHVSVEWRDSIVHALRTMDCLIAYMTSDFFKSDWCSQEVGYACVAGAKVLPIKFDQDPCAFLSFYQALEIDKNMNNIDLANKLATKILEIDFDNYLNCLIPSLNFNSNYGKTSRVLNFLVDNRVKLPSTSLDVLKSIYQDNDQVRGLTNSKKLMTLIEELSAEKIKK